MKVIGVNETLGNMKTQGNSLPPLIFVGLIPLTSILRKSRLTYGFIKTRLCTKDEKELDSLIKLSNDTETQFVINMCTKRPEGKLK